MRSSTRIPSCGLSGAPALAHSSVCMCVCVALRRSTQAYTQYALMSFYCLGLYPLLYLLNFMMDYKMHAMCTVYTPPPVLFQP